MMFMRHCVLFAFNVWMFILETDRQTVRQIDRQRDRPTDRQRGR